MPDNHNAVVIEIRRFNRFYTRLIGLLEETLTRSVYTLTEARVLFELGHRSSAVAAEPGDARGFLAKAFHLDIGPVASEIADELRLDPAYLTRILRKFSEAGLTEVRADPADRRRRILSLTARGSAELAGLQAAADREIARLTAGLGEDAAAELSGALQRVMRLLGGGAMGAGQIVLRPHRIGDIGWVIQRQAALYAGEYGWNGEFEAFLAEIGRDFIRDFREGRDFCWIAERDGEPAGAVFLVHDSSDETVAKLRMLHVEHAARGLGVGRALVETCVEQARACGYAKLSLWTNDILATARRIYERSGFVLTSEDRHHSFGKDLVGQYWEMKL